MIEQSQGFPAASQKLIHAGKVLKDNETLESYQIKENDFMVCMVTKAKKAKPAAAATPPAAAVAPPAAAAAPPAAAEAPPAEAAPTDMDAESTGAADASPAAPAAPAAPAEAAAEDPAFTEKVTQLQSMGFPEDQCRAALRAAFDNSERAVEYLMTGIPAGAGPMDVGAAGQGEAPAEGGQEAAGGPLEALRRHPQFDQLRQLVQSQPAALGQVLQQIGQQDAELLRIINENRDEFVKMMNEPVAPPAGGGAAAMGGGMGGMAAAMGAMGGGQGGGPSPQQITQMLAGMNPEQREQMAQQMGMTAEQLQQVAAMMAQMPPEAMQQMMGAAMGGGMPGGGMPGGGMPGGGAPPGAVQISLTPEEAASVEQLVGMGFAKSEAVQAFLACDKNVEMAANFLFSSMDEG